MHDTRALTSHLAALLRREHAALADFLVALADFDRERRWIELGYTSCFYFLHRELGLSKGAAFYRKTAAELLQRYPELVEPLRDGRLCLTSVVELAKVITPENRGEVVQRFFHASKAQAREVVAELCPAERPPQRDVVTAVSGEAAQTASRVVTVPGPEAAAVRQASSSVHPANHPLEGATGFGRGEPGAPAAQAPQRASPVVPADDAEPLTADLRRLHVTVSRRFLDKLAAARDALSHSHPGATTEAALEAALDLLLAADRKRKGHVVKPRKSPAKTSARPRHIPAEVKRVVWQRDGGRCVWPMASGGVCGSTTRLELDHVVPVARGGASTVDNLRITCAFHNKVAAQQLFGEEWLHGAVESARRSRNQLGRPSQGGGDVSQRAHVNTPVGCESPPCGREQR